MSNPKPCPQERSAVCCSVLQCVAVCCSVLQRVAVCCSVLQCVAVCCSVLQCVAVYSMLQSDAVWCSMLQHVAACCSKLPYDKMPTLSNKKHESSAVCFFSKIGSPLDSRVKWVQKWPLRNSTCSVHVDEVLHDGAAMISRLLENISLFCRI